MEVSYGRGNLEYNKKWRRKRALKKNTQRGTNKNRPRN